ncbi:uncharacterized protein LOC141852999 isoform X2 [Brevipalpus obovatus]|uniref:uncharacterized protein LOC141852999 isoform X2 n=1 Tax=Brevipalpus obovatus TaxID=246614 RepID=UPI003D9EA91C
MISRKKILSQSCDKHIEDCMPYESQEVWFNQEQLFKDHIKEILDKWDQIDDDIWAKVIFMERNRRVAKAYVRTQLITFNGTERGFDGHVVGLRGFANPRRDDKTVKLLENIGEGFRMKIDESGDILVKRLGANGVTVISEDPSAIGQDLIESKGILQLHKALTLFQMKKLIINISKELQSAYPDRRALERQCISIICFDCESKNILQSACWMMVINIVAMEMIKAKLPPMIREQKVPDFVTIFQQHANNIANRRHLLVANNNNNKINVNNGPNSIEAVDYTCCKPKSQPSQRHENHVQNNHHHTTNNNHHQSHTQHQSKQIQSQHHHSNTSHNSSSSPSGNRTSSSSSSPSANVMVTSVNGNSKVSPTTCITNSSTSSFSSSSSSSSPSSSSSSSVTSPSTSPQATNSNNKNSTILTTAIISNSNGVVNHHNQIQQQAHHQHQHQHHHHHHHSNKVSTVNNGKMNEKENKASHSDQLRSNSKLIICNDYTKLPMKKREIIETTDHVVIKKDLNVKQVEHSKKAYPTRMNHYVRTSGVSDKRNSSTNSNNVITNQPPPPPPPPPPIQAVSPIVNKNGHSHHHAVHHHNHSPPNSNTITSHLQSKIANRMKG